MLWTCVPAGEEWNNACYLLVPSTVDVCALSVAQITFLRSQTKCSVSRRHLRRLFTLIRFFFIQREIDPHPEGTAVIIESVAGSCRNWIMSIVEQLHGQPNNTHRAECGSFYLLIPNFTRAYVTPSAAFRKIDVEGRPRKSSLSCKKKRLCAIRPLDANALSRTILRRGRRSKDREGRGCFVHFSVVRTKEGKFSGSKRRISASTVTSNLSASYWIFMQICGCFAVIKY